MIACLCRAVAILTNHEIQTAKERHKKGRTLWRVLPFDKQSLFIEHDASLE